MALRKAICSVLAIAALATATAQEANLRITEVDPSTGVVEVTNFGPAFTQTLTLPFCYRFTYPTAFAAGTSWTANEVKTATVSGLDPADSDLWLYLPGGFADGNNIIHGLKWGPQSAVGRMGAAAAATPPRWPGTTTHLPAPGAGRTLAWNGDADGGAFDTSSWYVDATPSLGTADAPTTVGGVATPLAWENTVENFEGLALGDSVVGLQGWPLVNPNENFFVRSVNDVRGSTAAPPFSSTKWLRISDNDPTNSNRFYSNAIAAPGIPATYTWRFRLNIEELPPTGGSAWPRFTVQHDDTSGFANAWGIEIRDSGAWLVVTGIGGTAAAVPFYSYTSGQAVGDWVLLDLVADFQNGVVRALLNGGGEVTLPINLAPSADRSLFRLCYRGEGANNTAVFALDDVQFLGTLPSASITGWMLYQ
ncbi:MAG: hypothetical protein SF028_08170 [Candidatus Sumerlaeia bacterium]|nr:hypothetical protein [Candidatus Sumerlaeia bacterium]